MTDWGKIAKETGQAVDDHSKSPMDLLTTLGSADLDKLILETGISHQDLTAVLNVVKDATKSNEQKAQAIANISKGVDVIKYLAGLL